jgi:integrase
MGNLNDKAIRAAKVDSGERFLADGDGLYLRVRTGDSPKVWFYRYTMGGIARKIQLGAFPYMGLADARTISGEMTGKRRQGIDPIAEKEAAETAAKLAAESAARARAREAARVTMAALYERWATIDLVRHKDGGTYVCDQMTRHVLPEIGTLLVEDVRKGDITRVTDKLLAEGKNRTAKVVFGLIRQMLRFAVDRGVIEFDPSTSIRKAAIGGKETERERVLSEAEVRELHGKLPKARLISSTEAAVWIALSTCCRIGELLSARWADLDIAGRVWTIPETKNGRPHKVYLSNFAAARFEEIRGAAKEKRANDKAAGKSVKPLAWVFPDRKESNAVSPKTVTKQLADRQREPVADEEKAKPMTRRSLQTEALRLSGGYWSPHDLRRTGATMMVALGVLPEVAERCLNHTEENKVKRIYQRHSYENEMRQAWALLGERLELLTSDKGPVFAVEFGKTAG